VSYKRSHPRQIMILRAGSKAGWVILGKKLQELTRRGQAGSRFDFE
jgi:hypothetical protein